MIFCYRTLHALNMNMDESGGSKIDSNPSWNLLPYFPVDFVPLSKVLCNQLAFDLSVCVHAGISSTRLLLFACFLKRFVSIKFSFLSPPIFLRSGWS